MSVRQGQGLVEYGLIIVLVAIALVGVLTLLGPQIMRLYATSCPYTPAEAVRIFPATEEAEWGPASGFITLPPENSYPILEFSSHREVNSDKRYFSIPREWPNAVVVIKTGDGHQMTADIFPGSAFKAPRFAIDCGRPRK